MRLVLDAEALNALAEFSHPQARRIRRALSAAHRLRHEVTVTAVTLAELYRGTGRSRALDAFLAREAGAIAIRDTDRQLARLVGGILAEAELGSSHLADAHAVAAAVESGGGVVLTGDVGDLQRLAAPYRSIVIEPIV